MKKSTDEGRAQVTAEPPKDEAVAQTKAEEDKPAAKDDQVVEEGEKLVQEVEKLVENTDKKEEDRSIAEERPVVEEKKEVQEEKGDEIIMEQKEPAKVVFSDFIDQNEKAPLDELRELDYVSFELLIRNITKLIVNSFKKNDLNHIFCSQYIRVPINCLMKDKQGITGLLPDKERKLIKGYMLELSKQGLWDKDLDALGQLNFYEADVFEGIENQGTFHPYYIQIMQHISSSKAPNLQNLIRDNMIYNFLSKSVNFKHLFPRLYELCCRLPPDLPM